MSVLRQPSSRPDFARDAALFCSALALGALTLAAAGCARQPAGQEVLATVGDAKVTRAYYEDRLAKLKPNELPRGEDGELVDTSTLAGKRAFLEVIINKELMAQKAKELGYGQDEHIDGAALQIMDYNASRVMHEDLVEKPASSVTDDELLDYYNRLKSQRRCSFIITNFRDDAFKARQAVIDGGLWEDVADEFNDGSRGPNDDYTMKVGWGQVEDNFEKAIFTLKDGELSQPIETVYGWWVVRLDGVDSVRVAPLETLKERILTSIRARKINLARKEFIEESRRQHGFKMDEAALWIIYQGLPENEVLIDPATNRPTPRERLQPLNIPLADMDRFFYSLRLGDKEEVWTVGDYKDLFDRSNVFERPKKEQLLGGLRQNIMGVLDRQLLIQEAKERGYLDDPRVRGEVDLKREQMMVSKLHQDLIRDDSHIPPEEVDAFWAEHQQQYRFPEKRSGHVVYCAEKDAAERAREAAASGRPWREVLERFGKGVPQQGEGEIGPLGANEQNPLRDALFSLAETGQASAPFQSGANWAVVRLSRVEPERQAEKHEVMNELGQRIRQRREEAKLQQLLEEWRGQFPVKIHEKNLDKVRAYEELATPAAAPAAAPAAG